MGWAWNARRSPGPGGRHGERPSRPNRPAMRSLPWRSDPAYRLIDPCLAGRSPHIGATRQKGCAGRRTAAAAGPCLPVRMLLNRDGTDRREPGAWGGWRSSDRPADGARRGHSPSLTGTEIADIGLARPRARRPDRTAAGEIAPIPAEARSRPRQRSAGSGRIGLTAGVGPVRMSPCDRNARDIRQGTNSLCDLLRGRPRQCNKLVAAQAFRRLDLRRIQFRRDSLVPDDLARCRQAARESRDSRAGRFRL